MQQFEPQELIDLDNQEILEILAEQAAEQAYQDDQAEKLEANPSTVCAVSTDF